ncbi:unnamed protein product, partial [Hapterophycus canaliculatus]
REGSTPQETRSVFTDLFQRLGQDERVQDLDLLFCGPNIASHLHNTLHSFPYYHAAVEEARSGSITSRRGDEGVLKVKLRYNCGLYHNVADLFAAADALFLFNAGLWGYDDWEPTLEHAGNSPPPAVVVTSYCQEEASDDMETEMVVSGLEWLWEPEVNPHRSLVPRRTECGVKGRKLFENHSWQAL